MKYVKILSLSILIACLPFGLSGQKVGLVLSGGGSKGVAHIGVIKALEEHHIPIDYITGTSMGAIVGGLYAAGYSPAEMDSLIKSDDFLKWARGEIEDEYTYFYMKEQPNSSWISLKLNYDSLIRKPLLPSSIVQPFQMDFAFMHIFTRASTASENNFDSLFIPFRCMASDIQRNESVVLSSGNLGKAIRASMSYPFYFKPVTIDNRILLDGGMYNNFPSDVMLNTFSPDMIIGSKVAGNYTEADPSDIISQIQTIMMEQTEYDVLCESSVLIEPNIPAVNVLDFSRRDAFIDSGYIATKRKLNEIRLFLTDSISPELINKKRQVYRKKMPALVFNKIIVNGLDKNESYYINRMLLHDQDTVDIKSIKQDYFRVLADQRIEYIYPEAIYNKKSGFYQLNLEVKKDRNLEIQFGGTVSSSPINEAFIEVKYKDLNRQALNIRLNSYIGRFYSSVSAVGRLDFAGNIPYYLRAGTFYNQWDFFKTSTMFFEDKTPSYLIKNDFRNSVIFGAPITNNSKLEAGFSFGNMYNKYYQSNQFSRQDTVDKTTFLNYNTHFTWEFNTLNRKQFASNGKYFKLRLKHFRGNEIYEPGTTEPHAKEQEQNQQWIQLYLKYLIYTKVSKSYNIGLQTDLFMSNRNLFANHTSNLLMAKNYAPIPEANTIFLRRFIANNYIAFGLKNIIKLQKKLNLRIEGYAFQPAREILSENNGSQAYLGAYFDKRYFITSGRLVYYSPIGPVSMYLNYYQGNEDPLAFGINIGYILFNDHTLE